MGKDRDEPKVTDFIRVEAAAAAGKGDADTARKLLRIADEMDGSKNDTTPKEAS